MSAVLPLLPSGTLPPMTCPWCCARCEDPDDFGDEKIYGYECGAMYDLDRSGWDASVYPCDAIELPQAIAVAETVSSRTEFFATLMGEPCPTCMPEEGQTVTRGSDPCFDCDDTERKVDPRVHELLREVRIKNKTA